MDDLTEIFTLATWPDVNGMSKFPWDHHSGSILNPMVHSHYPSHDNMLTAAQQQAGLSDPSIHGSSNVSPSDINSACHAQTIARGMQEAATRDALRRIQEGSCSWAPMTNCPNLASSSRDMASSIIPTQYSAPSRPTWHQVYIRGVSSSPHVLSHVKAEAHMLQDGPHHRSHLCGGTQDCNVQTGPNEGVFIPICGPQGQPLRTPHSQVSHGISAPSFSSHTGIGQPQGAAAVVAGTARPRVRARRGQATDPHSIAERLRRERIADRMKALQELVPNANKTDKASMLDEIIEYVRFLRLQVKILSMSRLSGTGAVVPLVSDIPGESLFEFSANLIGGGGRDVCSSQDSALATERQVARLMEESMGSALQFLQSKGLCLMPISLAIAMSRSSNATGSSHGKTEASSSSTSIRASSGAVIELSAHCTCDMVADEVSSAVNRVRNAQGTIISQHNVAAPLKPTIIKPMANITKINSSLSSA